MADSLKLQERGFNHLDILDLCDLQGETFQQSLEIVAPTTTATAEASASDSLDLNMQDLNDQEGFFCDPVTMGKIPRSLDELVDLLDIKASSATNSSHDIQHFTTFASEDLWPI